MEQITELQRTESSALYSIDGEAPVDRFVFTSPETRAICNDPFVVGVRYTKTLSDAMSTMFSLLKDNGTSVGEEDTTVVLHILRGGLNFGIREALADAYGWNRHSSAYISSQRAKDDNGDWHITENRYEKVYIPQNADIIVGDVVATGVSLEHAMLKIVDIAKEQGSSIRSITFVTIGGARGEEVVANVDAKCREAFDSFESSRVMYLEGRFDVAQENDDRVQIGLGGTDFLRRDCIMTPEFVESQGEALPYALERCTIYDAGSRAFHLEEYMEDVRDYWTQVKGLAENGTTLSGYLKERMPSDARVADESWMAEHDTTDALVELAQAQIGKAQ